MNSLDLPVAWLSLDPADDDPARFFACLVAALQTVDEILGQEIEGVLRAGQASSKAYQMAVQHGWVAGNFVAEMMSVAGLALLALEQGQLHLAFEIASPVSARVERSGSLPPIAAVVYGVLGEVCYPWHQLEQARKHILRAIHPSSLVGYNSGAIHYGALLARLLYLVGTLTRQVS